MALQVKNVRAQFQEQKQQYIKILVGGTPGAGKTRSASTWDQPLFADVEGRLMSVRDRDVHAVRITSMADLEELRSALAQNPEVREKMLGVPVRTVVLDTVDEIAKLVVRERLRSEKQETMRMADWGYLGDTLRSLLRGFRNLDMNVVMNVHLKVETDGESGRMWERPDIQGQVGNEIAAYVDISGLLVARTVIDQVTGERIPERVLQTFPDSAHTWVKDHSGTLPAEFPINLNDDYERLAELIFGARPKADAPVSSPVASVALSTSEDREPVAKKAAGKRVPGRALGRPQVDVPLPRQEEPAEEIVPTPGTEADLLAELGEDAPKEPAKDAASDGPVCADCGAPVTNRDQLDISMARWNVPLCRSDFAGRKARKKT